jgi:hypothetical protein
MLDLLGKLEMNVGLFSGCFSENIESIAKLAVRD